MSAQEGGRRGIPNLVYVISGQVSRTWNLSTYNQITEVRGISLCQWGVKAPVPRVVLQYPAMGGLPGVYLVGTLELVFH